jgi:two-component system alkaline phosphatase synthesis response regulator PhoP
MSHKPTILVVDDDAFIRRPLEFILRKEGFDPVTAADGDECMDQLAAHRPDLIIMDVMMPGTDGFELCATIKRSTRYSEIPVLLLSARGRDHDRNRGLRSGAAAFMTKPYSPSELLTRVREMLSGELTRGQTL